MIPSRATAERCAELLVHAYATNAPRPMAAPIDGGIVLAFAGSRTARDWEMDAMAWQCPVPWLSGAPAHRGFQIATEESGPLSYIELERAGRIVVTGHSLGAAIALLTAVSLCRWGAVETIEVVAFGCPRVGGQAWHRLYRDNAIPTLRIYRDWDPVASAPAWWGWRHVGESLHVTRHGQPIADPTTPWGKLRRLLDWHVGDADHSMPGYQAALAAHGRGGFAWPT